MDFLLVKHDIDLKEPVTDYVIVTSPSTSPSSGMVVVEVAGPPIAHKCWIITVCI